MESLLHPEQYNYEHTVKQVNNALKIQVWEESQAYQLYLGFIMSISESIVGRKITEDIEISCNCKKIIQLLETVKKYSDETPPVEMQVRYGNPAYRDWYEKLDNSVETLLEEALPVDKHDAIQELAPYLMDSFGNWTRIDYGTGHEMAFVMFVCCLFKIGVLTEEDKLGVGLKLFTAYFDFARHLQQSYRMEPAGSMGVWNLDDYQFVSFILGAAQLSKVSRVKPKSIPDPEISDLLCKDYHFYACLSYIHQVKTGPFHEHSNQLWNISAVQLWSKVFTGLIKMYRAEVLCKFPVIQHTLFGSIFSLEKAKISLDIPGSDRQSRPDPSSLPIAGPLAGGLMPGRMPGSMPGAMLGSMPGRMPMPGTISGQMPLPGTNLGQMPMPGTMPDMMPGRMPMPGQISLPKPKPSTMPNAQQMTAAGAANQSEPDSTVQISSQT